MRIRALLGFLSVCPVLAGCGVFTKTQPTKKGTWALEAAVGGPLASVAQVPVPLPLSSVGASVGLWEDADLSFHLHPSPLFIFRTLGLDVGSTVRVGRQKGWIPALALTGRGYAFSDFRSGTLGYVELTPAASLRHGTCWETFVSTSLLWHVVDGRYSWAVGVGEKLQLGRWSLGLELRLFDPQADTTQSIQWVRLGNQGAVGVLVGLGFQ